MARARLDLQAYQQDILDRLRQLQGGVAAASSRLGVVVGGTHWLVALADISEVIPLPEILRVPQTQAWFMGVANVRGNLYALTDLGHFFGHAPTAITADSRILLVHPQYGTNAGLLVERLVGLRVAETMEPLEDASAGGGWRVRRHRDENGEIWHELELGRLLAQPGFMQVAA